MILLTTDWTAVWSMTGIGIGTVIALLALLSVILAIFSRVTRKTRDKVKAGVVAVKEVVEKDEIAENTRNAAIATAVYLYMQGRHDEESGILTIRHTNSNWHAVLNKRL